MNLRESLQFAATLDGFKTGERIAVEPRRLDAVELRQVSGELLQPFSELAPGAGWIGFLVMIEADSQVNHALQKEPPRAAGWPPQVFEDLVALEKRLPVEELDAESEWIAGRFHFSDFTFAGVRETNRASGAVPAQR